MQVSSFLIDPFHFLDVLKSSSTLTLSKVSLPLNFPAFRTNSLRPWPQKDAKNANDQPRKKKARQAG